MMNEMNTVTVNTLRNILKSLNIKTSGKKEELISRLNGYCEVVVKDGLIILIKDGIEAQYDMSGKHIMDTEVEVTDWAEDFAQAWVDEEAEPIPVPQPQPASTAQFGSAPIESINYIGIDGLIHQFKYRKMSANRYKDQMSKCKEQFSRDAVMLFKDLVLNRWIIKVSSGLYYDIDKNVIGQDMNVSVEKAAEKAAEEIIKDISGAECPVKGHKDIDAECGSKIRQAVNEAKASHEATREWEKANKTKAPNHVPGNKEERVAYNTNAAIGAQNEALDPITIALGNGAYKATEAVCKGILAVKGLFKKKS